MDAVTIKEVGLCMPRTNAEWLADLRNSQRQAEALADLRQYLLRAVALYVERHHEDLTYLGTSASEHLAEDFAQEALLQIQANLDTFRGESKFTTWAYRFVINIAATELRLARWRTVSLESLIGESEVPLLTRLSDQGAPDPETVAVRNQIIALIREIITEELTERQRSALVGVHFNGMPMAEVARQLGTTPNNVYKLIHEARKKLKNGLRRRYYSEGDVLAIFSEL
jgi:RNA polymerase sigma-70 factor (ECF subfamily)